MQTDLWTVCITGPKEFGYIFEMLSEHPMRDATESANPASFCLRDRAIRRPAGATHRHQAIPKKPTNIGAIYVLHQAASHQVMNIPFRGRGRRTCAIRCLISSMQDFFSFSEHTQSSNC